MKKLFALIGLTLSLSSFMFFVQPATVGAVDVIKDVCSQPTGNGERPAVCNTNENASSEGDSYNNNPLFGKNGVITRAIQILIMILGIIVVFVIMINAVRLITSNGDTNTVTSARNGIIYAVVGAVIALSAQLIVSFVLTRINT